MLAEAFSRRACCPNLRSLCITFNASSDEGLIHLFEALEVGYVSMTEAGAMAISCMLRETRTGPELRKLMLTEWEEDQGAGVWRG